MQPEQVYESKSNSLFRNPSVVAALVVAGVAAAGHWVVNVKNEAEITLAKEKHRHESSLAEREFEYKNKLAGDEFCYKVLADAMTRNNGETEMIAQDVNALGRYIPLGEYCKGNLQEFGDRARPQAKLLSPTAAASQATSSAKSATTPSQPASGATATASEPSCKEIRPIKELGWTRGHKTNYCRNMGYDGVHNPYGNYAAGGYCFKGDAAACIAVITGG